MDNLIVTGAVIAFLLLILPAVLAPFLSQNPTTLDTTPQVAPDPVGPNPVAASPGEHHSTDRIAA